MKFRVRDYSAEEAAYALPRVRTHDHPLAARPPSHKVNVADHEKGAFYDPLREPSENLEVYKQDVNIHETVTRCRPRETVQLSVREWAAFKRSLTQKFPFNQTISISSVSDAVVRSGKATDKSLSSLHLEELDDPQKFAKEEVKVITRQEYVSRLHELKDEIGRAWRTDDRVTSLKLSIKVARLLMDTSVLQFYPTLVILVTDVLDMLGNLVWERIKRKAEYADDGTSVCCLPENFKASDICHDAKETCINWFNKIGSIHELLPRIYLELAILRCWHFLQDNSLGILERLTMMIRGLADPLASAYCRLYMARCAQTLPLCDTGYLIASISDITILLKRILSRNGSNHENIHENKKLLMTLLDPTIEWIVKCIVKNACQVDEILAGRDLWRNVSKLTGDVPCVSIVLHHLLKELPSEIVNINALEIVQLIEYSKDISLDQYLNYRLLGLKLCDSRPTMDSVDIILDKVFQVVCQYGELDEYLKVADAYLDIVLQCQMGKYLTDILDGVSMRASSKGVTENEFGSLQSILIKILIHFTDLEDAFALNHFMEILDVMHGSSRNMVNRHILIKATRGSYIHDATIIGLLFEISQALHDGMDFSSIRDDDHQQTGRLISYFVSMVDFGADLERHLAFLVECRAAFGSINELKETLVHSSNYLAIKAIKVSKEQFLGFVKSCIAFNEVTIPSVAAIIGRMNLYLETSEVALLGGLFSHTDGLIESAISTLQSLDIIDGSRLLIDAHGILSSTRKLCSFLVMVPGNSEQGIGYTPRKILSLFNSQSWITPELRIKMFCAIVSLAATISQNKLPYHSSSIEVVGNDQLFLGEPSYLEEILSISSFILENLVVGIEQEPSAVARGKLALEACNCIISSFEGSEEISLICSKLTAIAKSCLNVNNKYLQSTLNLVDKHLSTHTKDLPSISI
ncbi:uncharacterized protein LOC143861401 isoform X3 [Tasmannia lanceolata]|uniref:uncharacterized protein LOC143861401 isoform X3 n=1 Tax=Tasmannia lanceolata TaxID=3420 RepID=UPI004063537F